MRTGGLALALLASYAAASSGDRAPEYAYCVSYCQMNQCPGTDAQQVVKTPFSHWFTRWTCADECKYNCMHQITDRDVADGGKVHQYFGKWPFWQYAGMQEPASVLFSLLNLWAHARGRKMIREVVPERHPMKAYYMTWGLLSMNAWFWSAMFHTRDKRFTERLDYFSAALAIIYGLYYAAVRLFHLYPAPNTRIALTGSKSQTRTRKVLSRSFIFIYIAHVSYLSFLPRFDYAYNMAFNVVLGFCHNILWLIYAIPASRAYLRRLRLQQMTSRPAFNTKVAVLIGLTTSAISLELFDFPPWKRIVDAHALWHLATFPIAWVWYDFLVEDSLDTTWREKT